MSCRHPGGCERPTKMRGWCKTHGERVKRDGHPGAAIIPAKKPSGRPCVLANCEKPVTGESGRDMCGMHYQRWRKHGDPTVVLKGGFEPGHGLAGPLNPRWSETPSYTAAHKRVAQALGLARDHACLDCGNTARHWSYDNADPNELTDYMGRYSADPARYVPRCVSCHRLFDNAHRRERADA